MDSSDDRPDPDPTRLTLARIDREMEHARELTDLQFRLIEAQRLESKADAKEALAAALLTAKEQIVNLSQTYQTGHSLLSDSVGKLQNDVTQLVAIGLGRKEVKGETREIHSDTRANIAIAISLATVFILIITTILENITRIH